MKRKLLLATLVISVILHIAIVLAMIAAFFTLPFTHTSSWNVVVPLMVFIVFTMFNNFRCASTMLENNLRRKLGLRQIKTFVGFYLLFNGKYLEDGEAVKSTWHQLYHCRDDIKSRLCRGTLHDATREWNHKVHGSSSSQK
jgi:Ca2+/Na+ antiporter